MTGRFGGRLLSVVATDTAAHFEFPCWVARTGPLRPDDRGVAEGRGWAGTSAAGFGPADFRVIVQQHADSLAVLSTFITSRSVWVWSHTVRRDETADFSGVACLDAA